MAAASTEDRKGGGGNATASGILYQAGVGASFAARLLSEAPLDDLLGLPDARVKSIRFETNAPVDDLLIETDAGGFVAVQAKATITTSMADKSVLASVADQFVRHWIVTKEAGSSEAWGRPLDPARDRLLLVYGSTSGANVGRLAGAITAARPDGPAGSLRDGFEALLHLAFATNGYAATTDDIAALLQMIRLVELDPAEGDRRLAIEQLAPVLGSRDSAVRGFDALVMICTEQMKRRGGFDSALLRTELARHGIATGAAPTFARSIERLAAYSAATTEQLATYESLVPKTGDAFTLQRECLPEILAAARADSLILTGEPGSGKSGVLNSLSRGLVADGAPVVALAVDRLPVATLRELSEQLGLEQPLLDVLANWPGTGPGYLVIDALDATRGGPAETVFKALIAGALALPGNRWRVIASIRSFDLRLGRQLRDLFKGDPPSAALADPAFKMVRHVSVPIWTNQEFATILQRSPGIGTAIEVSGPPLAALARVPFNTRLLADLLSRGTPPEAFAVVSTQASLLAYFWQERVEAHGTAASLCLRKTVEHMIATGGLRAPTLDIAAASTVDALDMMEREGVLVRLNGGRDLAFRHHILFDFAASRLLLDPSDPAGLARTLVGPAALALAPALGFVLNEAWARDDAHAAFWSIALAVAGETTADPITRSVIARQAAELPTDRSDTDDLVGAMVAPATRDAALRVLRNLLGALSVQNEDGQTITPAPWLTVAARLPELINRGWNEPIGALRVLLHILLEQKQLTSAEWRDLGIAARALLSIALDNPNAFAPGAISFVGRTYDSDIDASRAILNRLLTPERLAGFAATDAPALANEIGPISIVDPEFASTIYRSIFDHDVTDEATTRLGNSQILSLTSTQRQDYSIARYALSEAFPAFLEAHPDWAIAAMVPALEAQARRETGADLDTEIMVETAAGSMPLVADRSFVWAWDIVDRHPSDAEKLLQATVTFLIEAPGDHAILAATALRGTARLGILWSRFLHAAAERPALLGDLAWPIASADGFLTANETSKDAIDAALAIYPERSPDERVAFERTLLDLDVSGFMRPESAHNLILRRTLSRIGAGYLLSDAARSWIASAGEDAAPIENDRPVSFTVGHGGLRSWEEEAGLDETDPAAKALFAAVNYVRERYSLVSDDAQIDDGAALLNDIEALRVTIASSAIDKPSAIASASDPIIKAVHALTANSGSAIRDVPDAASRLTTMVEWFANQSVPEVGERTEADFIDFPSWGSPAPRVDAADLAYDLLLIDPSLRDRLMPMIDAALDDPHPAVRLMAAQRLVALWFVDRDEMWRRVTYVAETEPNPGVLRFFVGHVLSRLLSEPDTLEPIVLGLTAREFPAADRGRAVEDHLAELVTALWLLPGREESHAWVERQLAGDIVETQGYLSEASGVAGQFLAAGYENDERVPVRQRAQALMSAIVSLAAATLADQMAIQDGSRDQQRIDASVQLLDTAVRRIRTAAVGSRREEDARGLAGTPARTQFLKDLAPLLERIGDVAPPRALHELIELLDHLLDGDPARSFELIAHGVLTAGATFGYQYESLGADRIVKVVGRALADHRWIFDDATRRGALIEMLELFVDQNWPQARRLLYELPELFR